MLQKYHSSNLHQRRQCTGSHNTQCLPDACHTPHNRVQAEQEEDNQCRYYVNRKICLNRSCILRRDLPHVHIKADEESQKRCHAHSQCIDHHQNHHTCPFAMRQVLLQYNIHIHCNCPSLVFHFVFILPLDR